MSGRSPRSIAVISVASRSVPSSSSVEMLSTPVAAPRVVILGAGLTGLSASMHLRRVGVPHRVLERSAGVGGLAATTSEAGYRFDRTGHLLHLRDASMRALVLELLGPGALVERALRASGEEIPYEALISTIPLPELIDRLIDPPAEVREARGALRATSLQYLDVALNTPCERPWHWVYVPDPRLSFYRVGCYTTFSAALAPTGKGSLYVELAQREPVELGDILPRVADELVELGLIRAREAIRFARLRNISPAYVIYDAARRPALDVILPFLEQEGIASVGRYGAWEYASMEDALLAGRAAAQRAAAEAER
jgi:protoporphyrinogen oxidase